MFYHAELQITGIILLTAMAAGCISLWLKRRREAKEIPPGDGPGPDGR